MIYQSGPVIFLSYALACGCQPIEVTRDATCGWYLFTQIGEN